MSRYLSIAAYNLRLSLLPQLPVALGVLALTPVLLGTTALDAAAAALPLELSLPFVGVALLTPIYAAERDRGILSVVAARQTPFHVVCLLRVVMALSAVFALIGGFVLVLAATQSAVTLAHAAAACANAVFLGGLGILASALGGNAVLGYMVPIVYYTLDLMGGKMPISLFSMLRGGTMDGKWALFTVGLACVTGSMAVRVWTLRRQ